MELAFVMDKDNRLNQIVKHVKGWVSSDNFGDW